MDKKMNKKTIIISFIVLIVAVLLLLAFSNNGSGFVENVKESFYRNVMLKNRYKFIIEGLFVTLKISALSTLFGSIIGVIVCFMNMQKNGIKYLAKIYIVFFRSTPIVLLLMITYYIAFSSSKFTAFTVSIVAFSMYFAAYSSEIFRAGVTSVGVGQVEAGLSMGFTKFQTYMYIVLPQAIKVIFPIFKGEFITLIKLTSVVGYIGVTDLTRATDIIRSQTFDAYFPLILTLLLYFIIIWSLTGLLNIIEKSINTEKKRRKAK